LVRDLFLKGFTVVSLQKNYFWRVKNQFWDEKITVNLLRKNEIKKNTKKDFFSGEITVNSLRKKSRPEKTKIASRWLVKK